MSAKHCEDCGDRLVEWRDGEDEGRNWVECEGCGLRWCEPCAETHIPAIVVNPVLARDLCRECAP